MSAKQCSLESRIVPKYESDDLVDDRAVATNGRGHDGTIDGVTEMVEAALGEIIEEQ